MAYVVSANSSAAIEIGATGVAEIVQNVRMIITTIKGSVPLDRGFGISATFLDSPLPAAMAAFTGEVMAEVQAQEPRCVVESVSFVEDANSAIEGRLYPVVAISTKENA